MAQGLKAGGGLDGLPIVVTGGAGALGRVVVAQLLDAGAICHLPLRDTMPNGLPWAGHPSVRPVFGIDLGDEAAVVKFYAGLPSLWASLHLAGGFASAPLTAISAADFEAQIGQNLLSAFLCCREAVRTIRARPAAEGGRIVNVAARPALEPRSGAGMVAYTAAKAGVAALTQALAAELKAERILVNAIVPSTIDTPANRAAMPRADRTAWSAPEDIARVLQFLAGPDLGGVTGALLPV